MTLYLLDANVLITAHNTYYPTDRVPEFWSWSLHHATSGAVKMPSEIFDEVKGGTGNAEKDQLFAWLQAVGTKQQLVLQETVDAALLQSVITQGYADDLTEDELEAIGQDPFLIAYALAQPNERCVVTAEVSAPAKQRANRRVPDVCAQFGVKACNPFVFYKSLNFKTNWQS